MSRSVVLFVGVLLAGVISLIGVPYAVAYLGACTDEERAAFGEFPQYGGVRQEPSRDLEGGSCAGHLEHVEGSPEEVGAYYGEQLRSHGWEVQKPHAVTATMSGGSSDGSRFEMTTLSARRNGFWYEVTYETTEFYDPPRPGTHVTVHVWES